MSVGTYNFSNDKMAAAEVQLLIAYLQEQDQDKLKEVLTDKGEGMLYGEAKVHEIFVFAVAVVSKC